MLPWQNTMSDKHATEAWTTKLNAAFGPWKWNIVDKAKNNYVINCKKWLAAQVI